MSSSGGFYGLEKRDVDELELVIIGAGAAGFSAAIYCSLLDINYLLLDAEQGGGLIDIAKGIENYPGVVGIRGPQLVKAFKEHLQQVGGELSAFEPAQAQHFGGSQHGQEFCGQAQLAPGTFMSGELNPTVYPCHHGRARFRLLTVTRFGQGRRSLNGSVEDTAEPPGLVEQ